MLALYLFCCVLLSVFSLHRVWLLLDFARRPLSKACVDDAANLNAAVVDDSAAKTDVQQVQPQSVAVQLPLYNEASVAVRLLDACAQMRWPAEQFCVQILDDSDDETTDLMATRARYWREKGVHVEHVRREKREGYKAGALAYGLTLLDADFVCVFDADFVPPVDFLERLMPAFDDDVGMVQARWEHLNRKQSWLTLAQAAFLDAHFSVEHQARARRGRFFNFNGTAGVWRKNTICDAGGWDAATLTEDLDLSFRAQLRGARFVYLDDVAVPAELPADVDAFKSQQHRWAKGSIQTARRLLGQVWRSDIPFLTKLDATLKLLQNTAFLFLALVMVTLPFVALQHAHGASLWVQWLEWSTLFAATGPVALHFAVAQWIRGRGLGQTLLAVPLGIGLGGALSLHNARAVLEGSFGKGHDAFVRTPKAGSLNDDARLSSAGEKSRKTVKTHALKKYSARTHPLAWLEFAVGILHLGTALLLISEGKWLTLPFLLLFGITLVTLSVQPVLVRMAFLWRRARTTFSEMSFSENSS